MFDENPYDGLDNFEAEDIDIFAELGVTNSKPVAKNLNRSIADETLAILVAENERLEEDLSMPAVNKNDDVLSVALNDATISKLLEILVKDDLHSLSEQFITEKIPAKAKLDVDSTKVRKNNDEYEISMILDVDGSGPVRPFAKVRSENNKLELSPPPNSIPNIWIPFYNALRDLLAKAMRSLSSTKLTIDKNI